MSSPARRVLGDKDKNANLKSRSLKRIASQAASALAAISTPRKPSGMAHLSSSPQAGSKRKIEEVEDAERIHEVENQGSQPSQLLSDSEPEGDQRIDTSTSVQQSYDTADTSFSASQNPFESHFELPQEEMSQRTLDKLNEVPMPKNNSQLPPPRPGLLKEMSAGSVGLSSFINFEGPPSTQASDRLEPIEIDEKSETLTITTPKPDNQNDQDPEQSAASTRKRMLSEKAAELQTRLQLAFYKVQTKQTSQPFSRLKVPKPACARSSSPPILPIHVLTTPRLRSSSTIREPSSAPTIAPPPHHPQHQGSSSAESHIATMRAQATNQAKPPIRNLNSLPMPRLDPALAAGSGMHIAESFDSNKTQRFSQLDEDSQDRDSQQQFPSSPPLSRQPSAPDADDDALLPVLRDVGTLLSSPPASDGGEDALIKTVSVSKGEAASGLVQLMTGGIGL